MAATSVRYRRYAGVGRGSVVLKAGVRPLLAVDRGGRARYHCGRCDVGLERDWRFCPECSNSIGWVVKS